MTESEVTQFYTHSHEKNVIISRLTQYIIWTHLCWTDGGACEISFLHGCPVAFVPKFWYQYTFIDNVFCLVNFISYIEYFKTISGNIFFVIIHTWVFCLNYIELNGQSNGLLAWKRSKVYLAGSAMAGKAGLTLWIGCNRFKGSPRNKLELK